MCRSAHQFLLYHTTLLISKRYAISNITSLLPHANSVASLSNAQTCKSISSEVVKTSELLSNEDQPTINHLLKVICSRLFLSMSERYTKPTE